MIRLVLLAAFALAACSLSTDGRPAPGADGTLVNDTQASVYAFAVDAETATRIDINPTIPITDETRDRVIAPGEDAPLPVEAYDPGDDVVVFVYRVIGNEAHFADTIQVDGPTFARNEGVVTVRGL